MAQITTLSNAVPVSGRIALVLTLALLLTPTISYAGNISQNTTRSGAKSAPLHDTAAIIQKVQELAWHGNYAAAIELLDKLPDTPKTIAVRARVLAWAGYRIQALAINGPLYQTAPNDYYLAWTQALAESSSFWPQQALSAYGRARRLRPKSPDTRTLALAVRLPLFSSVGLGYEHYQDSDSIRIDSATGRGRLRITNLLQMLVKVGHARYSAPEDGPFAPVFGGSTAYEDRSLLGLGYALTPDTRFNVLLGSSYVPHLGNVMIGQAIIDQRANDAFHWRFDLTRDRITVSPRSLDVVANTAGLTGTWRPTMRDTLIARLKAGHFDDGNNHYSLTPTWRHATIRNGTVMLDLGLTGYWEHNSKNTYNGYYSPNSYERIEPFASAYFNLGPEAGLYVAAATGIQHDETFRNWKQASDFNADLTIGIFTHWQLVADAAYSERFNQLGSYHATSFGIQLRYRFCGLQSGLCPNVSS